MDTQEIKDLIAHKIAGQGTQVDVGGALPDILNAILEKAEESGLPSGGTTGQVLTKKSDVDGDAEWKNADGSVFVDVEELPISDITKDKLYRKSEDVYVYQRKVLDISTTVWYGDGSHGFIEVLDEWQFIAFNVVGDIEGIYSFNAITAQDVNALLDARIIEVKSALNESKIFGTPEFFGASELVTVEKGAYKLFHNPTALPGKYIEVGGGIVVKRYETAYGNTPKTINPIGSDNPISVTIPLSDLGLDTSYDVVAVQRIGIKANSGASFLNQGSIIVVDYWAEGGNLILWLVSSKTTEIVTYGLSFTAYFVKKINY